MGKERFEGVEEAKIWNGGFESLNKVGHVTGGGVRITTTKS